MSNKAAIERTGKYLISGWSMMSTLCPICNSALLHLKRTGEIHCPGCDMPVVSEGAVSANPSKFSIGPSPVQNASPQPLAEAKGEEEAQVFHSLEEMKREYDTRKSRSQDVSGLLGERMLNGWTLLGASCEEIECNGTPLMSKPKSDLMECVKCNAVYKEGPDGELVGVAQGSPSPAKSERRDVRSGSVSEYESESPTRSAEDAPGMSVSWKRPSSLEAPVLGFSAKSEDDASAQIAQKLLIGWALLDEMCTNSTCSSSAPLMRDKEGVKLCLACGACDKPEKRQRAERGDEGCAVANQEVEVEAKHGDGDEEGDEEEDERDAEAFSRYAQQRFSAAMRGQLAGAVPRPEPRAPAHGGAGAQKEGVDVEASIQPSCGTSRSGDAVLGVLRAKLSSSAKALQECEHVGDSAQLADLILKLALAAKAVGDLHE